MYKVRNCLPGTLSIDLEEGAISLQSGQSFDLELVCSRQWILNDAIIQNYIAKKDLQLVHDSEQKISRTPTKSVAKKITIEPVKVKQARTEVISYNEIPIPPKTNSIFVEDITPPEPKDEVFANTSFPVPMEVKAMEMEEEKKLDVVAEFVEPMVASFNDESNTKEDKHNKKNKWSNKKKKLFGKDKEEIA